MKSKLNVTLQKKTDSDKVLTYLLTLKFKGNFSVKKRVVLQFYANIISVQARTKILFSSILRRYTTEYHHSTCYI